jgi:hypothetical protein
LSAGDDEYVALLIDGKRGEACQGVSPRQDQKTRGPTSFVHACLPFALLLEPETFFHRTLLSLPSRIRRSRTRHAVFVVMYRLGKNDEEPITPRNDTQHSFPIPPSATSAHLKGPTHPYSIDATARPFPTFPSASLPTDSSQRITLFGGKTGFLPPPTSAKSGVSGNGCAMASDPGRSVTSISRVLKERKAWTHICVTAVVVPAHWTTPRTLPLRQSRNARSSCSAYYPLVRSLPVYSPIDTSPAPCPCVSPRTERHQRLWKDPGRTR